MSPARPSDWTRRRTWSLTGGEAFRLATAATASGHGGKLLQRTGILAFLLILAIYTIHSFTFRPALLRSDSAHLALPPLYTKYRQLERKLPQHHMRSSHTKYLLISHKVTGVGIGTALQEHLLHAFLAQESGRAHVFGNYTLSNDLSSEYSEFEGKMNPARIPWSALFAGPLTGDAFPQGDYSPLAITEEHFRKVCSDPTIINGDYEVNTGLSVDDGLRRLRAWKQKLLGLQDKCVEVVGSSTENRVFPYQIFSSPKLLKLWPALAKSSLFLDFHFSDLVYSALSKNRHYFEPTIRRLWQYPPTAKDYSLLPKLAVLHIRRGDYAFHCQKIAINSEGWKGFNTFPDFGDRFTPTENTWGKKPPSSYTDHYLARCYPNIFQIKERLREVRKDHPNLKKLHIMTNGDDEWLSELKKELHKGDGWESISTSRDLVLTPEQKYISAAVDMSIARKADVFIGNGWSSLTSSINMLRMIDGHSQGVWFL